MQWRRLSDLCPSATMIARVNSASPSSSSSTLPSSISHATAAAAAQLIPCTQITAQASNTINMNIDLSGSDYNNQAIRRRIERLASESAVVVFSSSSCCLCHVAKRLLCSLGVSPTIHELDIYRCSRTTTTANTTDTYVYNQHIDVHEGASEDGDCDAVSIEALANFLADRYQADVTTPTVPAVFIGGKFLGGLDRLMAAHIAGTLVPLLKEAGALWL